ncbi:MAG TPA: acyl-CoA dehydrogenase family protein [Stellaceae bacterium]|nr:acyl-CoA dehydrogenase family protein [Stellaceae bacterium]
MDFEFSEEQLAIRDTIRELVQDKVAPRAAEIDEKAEYPKDIEQLFAANGILGIPFPEQYGGISGSSVTICMGIEEIAKACATSSLILAVQALGSYPILVAGSEEQKKRLCPPLASGEKVAAYALSETGSGSDAAAMKTRAKRYGDEYILNGTKQFITHGSIAGTEEQKKRLCPPLASGEKVAAYALSEPGSGSDAAAMTTRAKRYGNEYVLNGTKQFITHGSIAGTLVVFAETEPGNGSKGVSAFVLERETSPWTVSKIEHKLGIRGSPTAQIVLEDVKVPAANRLGEEGGGFKLALAVLDRSRPGIGAQALGIAEGGFDYALNYVKERQQFGQPIASFQGIQFMLADMATQIEAARHLVFLSATKVDAKAKDLTKIAAMAKLFASDMAMRVTTDCVQLLGGYGYIQDYPVERMMRDAKITQIYEGTNQIQRVVIARSLLR